MTVRTAVMRGVRAVAARGGYRLAPIEHVPADEDFTAFYAQCAPYTMTAPNSMYGLHLAMRYIAMTGIEGDVVECGVWRGGSAMLAALNLLNDPMPRELYLFDTFTGMSPPTEADVTLTGVPAAEKWKKQQRSDHTDWCFAPFDEVQANLLSTGFSTDRLHLVKGRVEDTLPERAPAKVALLRLDTDWYESTRQELVHLYPRLVPGGVLIVDDYGHWAGSRAAVDEFFDDQGLSPFLVPLDYSARVVVKPKERAT